MKIILPRTCRIEIVLLIVICAMHNLFAQRSGNVEGRIFTKDNKPASFVSVMVENTNKGTISDENGNYRINSIGIGNQRLTFSLLGLKTKSINIVVQESVTTALADVVLDVNEEQLQEVILEVNRKNKFDQKETEYVARLPLKNLENPQVYSVITSKMLEELQVTDIQSTLQQAPGISNVMQGIGSGGVGVNLYLRGFSADIAMRNGIGTAFRTSTDQANIERIEVIKGPSGTLFGTSMVSCYGGVVNKVTKKPFEIFAGSVGYAMGNYNLSRLTVDINTPLNKNNTVLFRFNGAKHNEHSFQDFGLSRNWFAAPSLTYKASDRLTLKMEAEIFKSASPSIYFNPIGAGFNSMDDLDYNFEYSYGSDYLTNNLMSYNVFAEARYKLSENWTSQTVLSSSNSDNDTNYLFLDFLNDSEAERRIMNIESQFYITQIQQNFIGQFNIGNLENKLLIGLDYFDTKTPYRRTQFVYDAIELSNPTPDFNPKKYENMLGEIEAFRIGQRDQSSFSIYVSDVVNFTDRLSVMASLRLDNFDDKENNYKQSYVAPKLGAVYQIVKDDVSVFVNYMNGFTNIAPDLSSGEPVKLKPEYASQVEGGVKAELFKGKLSTTLSYYNISVKDAVRYVNNGNVRSQIQDGEKSSKGFEIEVIANPIKEWNIVVGYANNDSEFVKADALVQGKTPYAAPKTTFNFWTSYKLSEGIKGLGFGIGANSISQSYVDDANTLLSPGYTVLSSSLFLDRPSFRIGLKFNNMTNEKYWANMGFYVQPQKTKNVVVSLMYKF